MASTIRICWRPFFWRRIGDVRSSYGLQPSPGMEPSPEEAVGLARSPMEVRNETPHPFSSSSLSLFLLPSTGLAQGVNGRARTYVSYPPGPRAGSGQRAGGGSTGEGVQRTLPDGTPATCGEVHCEYYRSGPETSVIPLLQDVELNVWTGVTGLRAYAHVRARSAQGDKKIWPRSEESFEALTAYVEYTRSFYRIQAGRMWQTTSLGFYNYDGGSISLRLPKGLNLDAYGGLSLVRGFNQPHHTELISSVESLEPRQDAYLGDFMLGGDPIPALSAAFTYQREGTQADDL